MIERLKPNGVLPIQLGWRYARLKLDITGGPFDAYPMFWAEDTFGVCVRAERVLKSADVHLPIEDFSVPKDALQVQNALRRTLEAALRGRRVYVGCMGGWGRTGLFLALVAKVAGVPDPVGYVREHYSKRAVETPEQRMYVEAFDVEPIRRSLPAMAWKARFYRLFS